MKRNDESLIGAYSHRALLADLKDSEEQSHLMLSSTVLLAGGVVTDEGELGLLNECLLTSCLRTLFFSQATSSRHTKEKDLRLEHLSWRIWFMKRKRAAALLEKHKGASVPDDTREHVLDEDSSDEEIPTPQAVKAQLAKSISEDIGKSKLPATIAADLPQLPQKLSVKTVPKEKESSKQW